MPEEREVNGIEEATRAVVAQHGRTIAMLKEHRAVILQNLNAYILDVSEAVQEIDKAIERLGSGSYHAESIQLKRPIVADTPPPTMQPATPHERAVAERDEEQIKLAAEFARGKPAPGYPVVPPPDAKVGKYTTDWVTEGSTEWSAGDEVDEQGRRHTFVNGRHKIWDNVTGKLLSDEPYQPASPNGRAIPLPAIKLSDTEPPTDTNGA